MKKLFRKSIACLIAVLMVVSTMPFTALTVQAATTDEIKAYVNANYNNIGTPSGYSSTYGVRPTNWPNYTDSGANYYDDEHMSQVYHNILWGKTDYKQNEFSKASEDNDTNPWGSWLNYVTVVMMYDGEIDPTSSMVVQVEGRKNTWPDSYTRYLHGLTMTNDKSALVNSTWKAGSEGTLNQDFNWNYFSSSVATTSAIDSKGSLQIGNYSGWAGSCWKRKYRLTNVYKYTGTPSDTTYQDSFNPTIYGYCSNKSTYSGTKSDREMAGATKILVVNYKPIKDRAEKIKTAISNIISKPSGYYTEASVDAAYNAANLMLKADPTKVDYSTNQQDAVNTAANAIKAAAEASDAFTGLVHEHSYSSTVTTQPTCTTAGVTTYTCACGDSYTKDEPAATGHSWGDWVYDDNKQEKRFCTICDTVDTEKRDCVYVEKSVTPATCSAVGKRVYSCTQCGNEYDEILPIDSEAHNTATKVETTNATCTVAGKKETVTYCTLCNKEISRVKTEDIPALGHDYTYTSIDSVSHSVICSRNCKEEGWSYTEKHNIKNGECTKCDYVAKVMITFVDENDGVISSAEYNIGADVVVPELPEQTEVYVGDSQHKVTTYSWNEIPQATASQAATYKRVKTESTVDCSNELKQQGETSDTWYCTVCGHEYERTVTDMSALKANITALETAVNVDDAAYKYEATALEAAKKKLDEAKAYVANDNNRYASIENVNAMSTSVGTAYTELTVNGLAKYSQTFIIRKDDGNGNTTDLATFTEGYENLAYGSTVEFSDYTIPTIEDESSTLNGLPMYAVYKWVKIVNGAEEKLGTTDVQISDVVKGETTYVCYVLEFKATDETQTTTRVRYLDKSGNTIKFDTATVGEPYTRKDTSIAPLIPYYNCTGWELVFGDETTVGTRELVYRAVYTFNETEANRCTIVGLDGVYVNGTTGTPGYTAYYDEKIDLTGADKFAYANADGSIIAPINENYIFAPHLNGVDKTIYITKVETPIEDAKSIITGVFTTDDDPTYNYLVINAQYYLPEGAKVVEAGAVIGKNNNADTLKIGSAVKVVSNTQGENHEYSLQMSYSKGKTGTLYARSYLIYVDSNGDTQTVYSDIAECVLN